MNTGAPVIDLAEEGGSQSVKAQLRLREMILAGELPGGARIAELTLVEKLGVSRTPIRAALMRLEQEGLLEALPNGGYAVRTFSERDVSDAIELRGTVEGLLARVAAERGSAGGAGRGQRMSAPDRRAASSSRAGRPRLFQLRGPERTVSRASWELSGSAVLTREMERLASLPFASPSAFVVVQANSPQARDMLVVAQDQHWQVLDAIERREGARAEAIMREHSRIAQRNLREAVRMPGLDTMPGVRLIRRRN
jgi:GntR family transcriptional regulator of vanillate catabolism